MARVHGLCHCLHAALSALCAAAPLPTWPLPELHAARIPAGWLRVVSLLSRLVLPSIARVPPAAPRATLDRLSDAVTVTPRAEPLARTGSSACGEGEGAAGGESEGEGQEAGEAGEDDGLQVARPRRGASVDGVGSRHRRERERSRLRAVWSGDGATRQASAKRDVSNGTDVRVCLIVSCNV